MQNFVQVGSNAAEFIKIMPGFGIQNGTSNNANYNGETIGINANGDAGSQSPLNNAYAYNGLPGNSLDITADGAHVSDPGCNCDTPVNPNSDMISEFKVLTSNFSAENQKGPAVHQLGRQVRRPGLPRLRLLLCQELRSERQRLRCSTISGQRRPENKYYYPGGTIGGPVLIPAPVSTRTATSCSSSPASSISTRCWTPACCAPRFPTPAMLSGNFSPTEMAKKGTITASGGASRTAQRSALAKFPGGIIPASQIDPNMWP